MNTRDYDKICQLATLCDHALSDMQIISKHMMGVDELLAKEVTYHIQAAVSLLDEIKARNYR